MTEAIMIQTGLCLDYTPAAGVAAGQIVQLGDITGIAKSPIAASALGALAVNGVYDIIKDGTTGPVFALLDPVFFNVVTRLAVRIPAVAGVSGVIYLGQCSKAAGTNEATVQVRMDVGQVPSWMRDLTFEDVTLAGGDKTLDVNDIGKCLNVTVGHDTNKIILLAVAAAHDFVIRCATTGQKIIIDPDDADLILGPDATAGADGVPLILAAATSQAGDFVHLKYFSIDGWRIHEIRGVWAI